MAPGVDCSRSPLVCENERCALKFKYEEVQQVNLAKDVPELKPYNGSIFSQVLLKQIDLDVTNHMNITTPVVDLYLAPQNVTSASMPGAQKIGSIPTQPPGTMARVTVPLDANAQQAFSSFAKDFQTPFNIITSTGIVVKSGDPVPSGDVVFTVSGVVEAKL